MLERVFFLCRFPSDRPFKDPDLARPACDAASARLLLCVAVLPCRACRMRLTPGAGQIPQARKASVVRASVAEEKTHELDNTHRTERAHRRRTGRALRPDLKGVCSSRASA